MSKKGMIRERVAGPADEATLVGNIEAFVAEIWKTLAAAGA
jgi:hypothetical protein